MQVKSKEVSRNYLGFTKDEEKEYDVVWCENGERIDDGLEDNEQLGIFDKYFNNVGYVRKFNIQSEFGVQRAQEGMVAMFGDLGYTVKFEDGACPNVDLKNKVVTFPILPEDISVETHKLRRCWTDHENAHILFTDPKLEKPDGRVGDLLNIIEDGRIEREFGQQYSGVKMNLEYGNEYHMKELMAQTKDLTESQATLTEAFIGLKKLSSGDSYEDVMKEHPNTLLEMLSPISDELTHLPGGKGTKASLEAAKKVDEIWGGKSKEEDRREMLKKLLLSMGEGQLKAAKEGEGEEGRKITLGEDEGKGGEPTKLDAEMRKELKAHLGDSIEIPASVRMENPSDYETHGKVIEMTVEDLYNSPRSIEHMGYDDLGKWTAEQIKSDSILAQDGKAYYSPYKTKDRISTPRHRGDEWAEKQINKLRTEGKAKTGVLVNKLLIHLKTLKPTWFRNQERGQLDDRVLAKVGLGSKRLFRKRIPQEQIDTAMTLLMDLSGSMTGSKSTLAIQTALIYSEVLESLDVPHEILGFTTDSWNSDHVGGFNRTIPLHHIIFKTFDEKMGVVRNRLASALTTSMRHNVDGEAVQWAGARISERKERRKIIMVLSDGYPEDGNWNSRLKAHLKKAVKEVESKGIGCIGVGMMSDAVEDFYRDSVVCDSLNAVPGAVLDKLKQVLLRLA